MIRFSHWLSRVTLVLAAVWAFATSFIIVADVVGRSVWGNPLKGTPEIIAASIVVIAFLQAGFAIRSGGMLKASFLLDHVSSRHRIGLEVFGYLLGLAFFLLLLVGSWEFAIESWRSGEYEGEGSLRIPSWPVRFLILFGAALAATNYAVMAYLTATGRPDVETPSPAGNRDDV